MGTHTGTRAMNHPLQFLLPVTAAAASPSAGSIQGIKARRRAATPSSRGAVGEAYHRLPASLHDDVCRVCWGLLSHTPFLKQTSPPALTHHQQMDTDMIFVQSISHIHSDLLKVLYNCKLDFSPYTMLGNPYIRLYISPSRPRSSRSTNSH